MATTNGYRSLGWRGGGALTPGSLADFTTIGLDSAAPSPAPTPPMHSQRRSSPPRAADVHHLVVGGRPVVVGGTHVSIDVGSELDSIIPKVLTS